MAELVGKVIVAGLVLVQPEAVGLQGFARGATVNGTLLSIVP